MFRATVSGGPYTQVGTATSTSFADSGLTCNTSYFYVVTASNGTCDSGNSAQVTATTSACGTCTTHTLYSNTSDTAHRPFRLDSRRVRHRRLDGELARHPGLHADPQRRDIFRYGGTTCTADYGHNDFSFAQPKGATGIAIPATATTNRLSFWHRRSFESGFDGGTLTVSLNGTTYYYVPPPRSSPAPPTTARSAPPARPSGAAGVAVFTGASTTMTNTTVDLDTPATPPPASPRVRRPFGLDRLHVDHRLLDDQHRLVPRRHHRHLLLLVVP